jgi:GNAT superfamily N-acetyltransferase
MGRTQPSIAIPREHAAEAAEVLALAFARDPLITYFLPADTPGRHAKLCAFFRFFCDLRHDLDWPLLGCEADGRIVAVACPSDTVDPPWPEAVEQKYRRLGDDLGCDVVARLETYATVADPLRPREPNYYLGIIGVHPRAQGRGYGRVLLDAVQALSEAHPTSTGVALDTELATNVAIYERCGYRVHTTARIGALDIWCMFRPNRPAAQRGAVMA